MSYTNRKWEAKLEIPIGAHYPDVYNGVDDKLSIQEFVISRDNNNDVVSRFKDKVWDFSTYHPVGRSSKIYFSNWCSTTPTEIELKIIEEMKWIIFLNIWKRTGFTISVGTIINYQKLVRSLASFSTQNLCKISDVLGDVAILNLYILKLPNFYISKLISLLLFFMKLGEAHVGYKVVGHKPLLELRKLNLKQKSLSKQHPPIPTRIYGYLISTLMHELSDFEQIATKYLDLVKICTKNPLIGRSYSAQLRAMRKTLTKFSKPELHTRFDHLVNLHELDDYFESKKIPKNIMALGSRLTLIQFFCKLTIHIYTGMRDEEVTNLTNDCLEEHTIDGKTHYLINGYTTKLNHGRPKKVKWVTSVEGARAVHLADKIATTIYSAISGTKKLLNEKQHFPLFLSTGYITARKNPNSVSGTLLPGTLHQCDFKIDLDSLTSRIEENDIRELELIDPYRSWRSEQKFSLGLKWPISTHQFRRSLTLYASSSGVVAFPSLRIQLKHITEEMTRYYGKGCASANNVLQNDNADFAAEYQNAQPENEEIAYLVQVLLSDERLFGAHGIWVERNGQKVAQSITMEDRKKTISKFKKGEMAFQETSLGGCTEKGICNKKAMRSIVECLECSRAVIKLSKLDKLILAQQCLVESLDENSMQWRVEYSDLEAFQKARIKFGQQKNDHGQIS